MLTRIVLWWSAFTSLTGLVTGYYPLLVMRFLFGMGEAGRVSECVGCGGAVVSGSRAGPRFWSDPDGFAVGRRVRSAAGGADSDSLWVAGGFLCVWGCGRGLELGLVLVVPRLSCGEGRGERRRSWRRRMLVVAKAHRILPWAIALRSRNFWATMVAALCYVYTFNFFQSWFHTYLVKARGFSEKDLLLSSLPFFLAACANLAGGLTSHVLVKRIGLKWGRCSLGFVGLGLSAVCTTAVMFTHSPLGALALLSLSYAGVTFQQPIMFAVCLDIGGAYAGAMVGAMNTASQIGSFMSSLTFGYLVAHFGNYNLPFIPMAVLLVLGAWMWLWIDPRESLSPVMPISQVGLAGTVEAQP